VAPFRLDRRGGTSPDLRGARCSSGPGAQAGAPPAGGPREPCPLTGGRGLFTKGVIVDKVVLDRSAERWDFVHVRIVWKRGAASEVDVAVPVESASDLTNGSDLEAAIVELAREGRRHDEVPELLTRRGFRSARSTGVAVSWIATNRARHGIQHPNPGREPRHVPGFLTVHEMAAAVGALPSWLYQGIRKKRVEIERDEETGMYLFPDRPELIETLRRLHDRSDREVRRVKVEPNDRIRGHQHG